MYPLAARSVTCKNGSKALQNIKDPKSDTY